MAAGAHGMKARTVTAVVVVLAIFFSGSPATNAARKERRVGDIEVFATLPYPGQPGGIAVDKKAAYIDTFAFVVRPTDGVDDIFAYDRKSGKLLKDQPNPIVVPRTRPVAIMGLSGMALEEDGYLYVVDMNSRILRVDPRTGDQEVYATFPTGVGGPITNMPSDLVFDREGYAYVTDIGGAPIIWRVPPGGGEAEPWFVDRRIAGWWSEGAGGIRIDPSGEYLYFVVIGSLAPETAGNALVFRLPLDNPSASDLEIFHKYASPVEAPPLGAGPLGIAFGASGNLYIAMPGASALSILQPNGEEKQRIPLPYIPQFLAFRGTGSLLVTTWGDVNSGPWHVLDVFVDDVAAP